MKIIDTHVHIGGEKVGFIMNEEMVTTMMGRYQIDHAIVSNGDSAEMTHTQVLLPQEFQFTQEESLERTLKFARQNPGKISVAPWVKPYLQGLTKELRQMMEDNLDIIKAIKLHPFHSNVSPTDQRMLPYLELADELHLPVVSHTGGCEAAKSYHLYEAAKLFPKVSFVMVHMDLGTDNKEAIDLMDKAENLIADTTWVPMKSTMEVIRRYGSERIVFGSDSPIDGIDTYKCNPKGERSVYQDYFHILPSEIDSNDYENLMWRNAERIFHL